MRRVACFVAWLLVLGSLSWAEDNGLLVIDATTLITNSSFTLGASGSSNVCIVTNRGVLQSDGGLIGYGVSANGNDLSLYSTGSYWTVVAGVYIGFQGSWNSFSLHQGARATNIGVWLAGLPSSSGNSLLVTDPGTTLSVRDVVRVGDGGGGGNRVLVRAGATVLNGNLVLGFASGSGGNSVLLTDTNTTWNCGGLNLGDGARNELVLSNGVLLTTSTAVIGSGGASAQNSIRVVSPGTRWLNDGEFYVGLNGSSNTTDIRAGAYVQTQGLIVGEQVTAVNNQCTVSDPGTRVEVSDDFGGLLIGHAGARNQLTVQNGASLVTRLARIGGFNGAVSNLLLVSGPGSCCTNNGTIFIGSDGGTNSLIVSNQGTVVSGIAYVGNERTANQNQVILQGTNSLWDVLVGLTVGSLGSRNRIEVWDGARLRVPALNIGAS